ncbi:MAG TPA: ABC transporter ATP-binding protein [Bacteroidales bacterium]|nr:ABC transporter ATP-binding protein [Bacteroidales bacterium]
MPIKDKTISRSLELLLSSSGRQTIVGAIILTLRSLLPLAVLFLIKHYIDGITGAAGTGQSSAGYGVIGLVAALVVALLLDDILSSWGSFISRKQAYLLEKHIASLIHGRSSSLGLSYFEDPAHHDMLTRAVRDISWRPAGVVSDIMLLFRGAVSFLAMAVVLSKFSLMALGVLVLAFIPVLWIKIRNSGRLYRVRKKVTPLSREASYFSWLLTGERPAREVKLFGLGSFFEGHYRKNFTESGEEELAAVKRNSSLETAASVVKMLIFGGILVYATLSFIDTRITAGEMAMYLVAFRQAMVYLRDAVSGMSGLAEDRLFLRDIFLFLDVESDSREEGGSKDIPASDDIEVNNLTFTYRGSASPALKNVSLKIASGGKVAIVGPNGSGKTTLVKILCGLYDSDSGSVRLGGKEISLFDREEYRKHFSVVFQDFMLYYLTAAENIKLGDTSSPDNAERLREAASKAGIAAFLEKLPEGYDTMLGHHTEGGRELSWGEWQKIAIARALYRDAPVLILDEPSSSLDADSEYEIFSRLGEIAGTRTCILVSHRLANVRDADRIVVLDNGKVVETGTHEELLASGGRYYSMFMRQKSLYK